MGLNSKSFGKIKNLSIVLATSIYPPDIGGPAFYVKQLAEELSSLKIEVKVICYGNEHLGNERFKIYSVSNRIPKFIKHFIYLGKLFFISKNCHIVYAFDALGAGFPAFLVSKLLSKKFLIRIGGDILWEKSFDSHGKIMTLTEFYQSKNYLNFRLFGIIKIILSAADKIIVPTISLAEIYNKYYKIPKNQIEVIFNPLPEIPTLEKKENLAKDIIFAGRLVKYKNLNNIIKAFKDIDGNLFDKFLIIGDGPERKNLIKLINILNLENKVCILPKTDKEVLFQYIKNSYLAISPSITDFNPNFILEAVAFKKPILISRINGIPINFPKRFLFNPFSVSDFIKKIEWLLSNYDEAKKEAENITFNWHWRNVIEKHLELFNCNRQSKCRF